MSKLLTLQVARGVAANLVVLQHIREFELRYAGTEFPNVVRYADLGVDVFFVLSGFIMVAIAGRNVGPLQFLWRRVARIYPTYWLATLIMLAVAIALPGMVHEHWQTIPLWRSFLLIAAEPRAPVVAVGWTLVHEVYFYAVFAVFLAFRIPILAGVAGWASIIFAVMIASPEYLMTSPVLRMATSPLTFEFMMGLVIGVLWLRFPTPKGLQAGRARITTLASLIALVLLIGIHYHFFGQQEAPFGDTNYLVTCRVLMFGTAIAVILYCLVVSESQASRRPPALLVALGDWSYSTYLTHFMVLSALGRAVLLIFPDHGLYATLILFVGGYLAVNLTGAAIYRFFEQPTLRRLHPLGPAIPIAPVRANPITGEAIQS
jgi:exopolysaccharide production protein ExoZ